MVADHLVFLRSELRVAWSDVSKEFMLTGDNFRGKKLFLLLRTLRPIGRILQKTHDGQSPNVLVILLDDTGFGNFGCYGSTIDTPNIDSLASGSFSGLT